MPGILYLGLHSGQAKEIPREGNTFVVNQRNEYTPLPPPTKSVGMRYENRSPFGLLNGALASYLLFSKTLCFSVAGACLVGAGSLFASWLGEPAVSVRGGVVVPLVGAVEPPIVAEDSGRLGTLSEYSRDSIADFLRRWSSRRA